MYGSRLAARYYNYLTDSGSWTSPVNTNYYYYRYFSPTVKKTITKEYDQEGNCIRKVVVVEELTFKDGVPNWTVTNLSSTDYKTLEMPLTEKPQVDGGKPPVEEKVEEAVEEKPKPKRRRKTKDIPPPPEEYNHTHFIMK